MDYFRDISEFFKPKPIEADAFDDVLLLNIMRGDTSVYKLWKRGKEEGIKPMLYKNVLNRIHNLRGTGLIEAIKGDFKHGAINYRLTSLGLVYLFSEGIMPMDLAEVMVKYPQNTLFQVFIYNHFEKITLQHCTDTLESFLINYIEECCQKIRLIFNLKLKHSYTSEILSNTLNLQLEWQTRSFFLNLVIMRDELIIDWLRNGDDDKNETLSLLSKDKKFMTRLKGFGDEFCRSYEALIELNKKSMNR